MKKKDVFIKEALNKKRIESNLYAKYDIVMHIFGENR